MAESPEVVEPRAGRRRVEDDAAARGIPIRIVERPAARSLGVAAELLGIQPGGIVKTRVG